MKNTNRWNAVCGESRMHGVEWGKARDGIRGLPITIKFRFYLYAEPGFRRQADSGKTAEYLTNPAVLCNQQ